MDSSKSIKKYSSASNNLFNENMHDFLFSNWIELKFDLYNNLVWDQFTIINQDKDGF
jgi:hypothetical protein